MIILGIETSCDETALALIETHSGKEGFECRVIESLVHSQAELHSAYGGVYPNLAKREHSKNLVPLLHKLLIASDAALSDMAGHSDREISDTDFATTIESFKKEFQGQNSDLIETIVGASFLKKIPAIDRIAVTEGPGLEPTLWVGINFARILSSLWHVPIIPVNHMEGHVIGSLLPSDASNGAWQKLHPLPLPAIALLISGGHTELVSITERAEPKHSDSFRGLSERAEIASTEDSSCEARKDGDFAKRVPQEAIRMFGFRYQILGQTKDDAVGEAFDKAARLLGLPYPGGPHIAKLAHEAYEKNIPAPVELPRPMIKSGDLDFSFSGLKTAVLYAIRKAGSDITDDFKKGLAREFETAVADTLDSKLRTAIETSGAQAIVIGGGVSANHVLRQRFEKTAQEFNIPIYLPSRHISGDNALMIALAGALQPETQNRAPVAHGTKRLGSEAA